jgi:hypothetical protein
MCTRLPTWHSECASSVCGTCTWHMPGSCLMARIIDNPGLQHSLGMRCHITFRVAGVLLFFATCAVVAVLCCVCNPPPTDHTWLIVLLLLQLSQTHIGVLLEVCTVDVPCCSGAVCAPLPTDHPWPGFVYQQSWRFFNQQLQSQAGSRAHTGAVAAGFGGSTRAERPKANQRRPTRPRTSTPITAGK